MSDQPEPNQPEPQAPKPDEPLGDAGLKALQAEREARKAAEDALKAAERERDAVKAKAQKWDEAEEAQKTELERAREEAAKALADAETARTEALRYRIANKHGVSEEDAETFLTASDEEGLERQAARLAEIAAAKRETERHTPDPSQGARKPAVKDAWAEGRERAKAKFGTE